jgi:hypothetical protein
MNEKEARIEELYGEIRGYQNLLSQTDYKALKHSEGLITDADYAETKAFRQGLRDKINACEEEIARLQGS